MDIHQDLRKFVQLSSEFLRHHADSCASELQRQLQIISTACNASTFDPSIATVIHFYASLHELLNGLDSRSMLVWSAISVLQKACTNPDAKSTLIHTFKFIPVLTRFLNSEQFGDKQMRLLNVMRDLTYGIKISWEEAHLPYLVSTLVQIIMEGDNNFKPISLEVLVNLCYDNLPVLYVLMGKVDITNFIKYITKLNDTPMVRLHVCKMLVIFEQIKGNLPDREVLNFVDVIFNTFGEAYQKRDSNLLRQILDFYKDVKGNHHFNMVASRYDKCYEDTKKILRMAEEGNGEEHGECLSILLEFMQHAISLNFQKTSPLMSPLLNLSVRHLHDDTTTLSSLKILQMIAEVCTSEAASSSDDSVITKMSEALPTIITLLDDLEEKPGSETKWRLTYLAALLTTMASNSELRKQILNLVSCDSIRNVFQFAFKYHSVDNEPVFHPENGELSVKMLSLVCKLANYRADWMSLSSDLINKKHVLIELAFSFAKGDKNIKYEVLLLTANNAWGRETLTALCEMMTNLPNTGVGERCEAPPAARSPRDVSPFYSGQQESRLNELLDALHLAKEEGRLIDSPTSSVMELYEYKLGALGQAERRVQAALEASDSRCTGLNHQLAQLRNEVLRLHERLFSHQLCIEGSKAEKDNLLEKQKMLKEQLKDQVSQHLRQVKEYKNQIQLLEKTNEAELKKLMSEHAAKVEELSKHAASNKADYEARIKTLGSEIEELKNTVTESIKLNQQIEKELAEKNKTIEDLERIRQMVISVADKKKLY